MSQNDTFVSKMKTNLDKVTYGWELLLDDWDIQTEKLRYEWGRGAYFRAIFHTLSGYKSSLMRFPYRTWSYLWEAKWLLVLYVWAKVPPPEFLVGVFS